MTNGARAPRRSSLLTTAVAAAGRRRRRSRPGRRQTCFKDDVHAQAGLTCDCCHAARRPHARTGRSRGRRSRRCARVPQRRGLHATVQAAAARGPVRPVSDEHARQADVERRDARRDLQRLSWRAWHPPGPGRAVTGRAAARRDDLRAVPFGHGQDVGVRPPGQSAGRLGQERSREGACSNAATPRRRRAARATAAMAPFRRA